MHRHLLLLSLLLTIPFLASAQTNSPDPCVSFGDFCPASLNAKKKIPTTAEILVIGGLSMTVPGFNVTSYAFSMKPVRGDYFGPYRVSGGQFTTEVREKIARYSGTSGIIYFEDIKAVGPDRRPRSMASVMLKYKND